MCQHSLIAQCGLRVSKLSEISVLVHTHMAEEHKHTEHPGNVSEGCSDLLEHSDTSKWEKLNGFCLSVEL